MNLVQAMRWFDFAALGVVLVGGALGAWSGVLRQGVRLLTCLSALYITAYAHAPVAAALARFRPGTAEAMSGHLGAVGSAAVTRSVGFSITFTAVYLALYVVTRVFQRAVKAAFLKPQDRPGQTAVQALGLQTADRLAGAAVGIVLGGLLAVVATLALSVIPDDGVQASLATSKARPVALRGAQAVFFAIPERDKAGFDQWLQHLQQSTQDIAGKVNTRDVRDLAQTARDAAAAARQVRDAAAGLSAGPGAGTSAETNGDPAAGTAAGHQDSSP